MSLRLRIEHGQDAGTTYRLPGPGVYTLGRVPQNSIRVLDMKVSKRHCEIRVVGSGDTLRAHLHDADSTHGCELNGQPVPRGKDVPMNPGDELRLGLTILRLLSDGAADRDAEPVAGRTAEAAQQPGASEEAASTPTLPPDELVGRQLGGYLVEKKIGAGGMGGVYLAEQVSLHRKVALKVLNETFAADSAFVDQFVNEARAAGQLNHPNVVQVYDVGSDQGRYFFSMEVMPGGSIEDLVRRGPIPWEDALNYFIDAANALIFAKKREILHRDVKPDNLMISEDDSAKLCDLGLAKKSEVGDLMDQGIIGTPHFISPEAIRRKPDIDHRTDLYSLGCSFYRIFTGQNPYPAGTVKEILLGHLNKPVPHVNAVNRDVPREIDAIVAQLMAKDPDERIQTPGELLRELDKIRTKYNLEAHGIKPASRKPLLIGGVAAALAIGVAIFFATRPEKVTVQEFTPEEIAQQKAAERAIEEKKLGDVVTAAATTYNERFPTFIAGQIDEEDNWKKPMFRTMSDAAAKDAEAWDAQVAAWREKKRDLEDPLLVEIYDTAIAELADLATKMRKIHTDIDKTIADRKKFEREIDEGKATARADAEKLIGDHARKVKALFDAATYDKWLDLEETIRGETLDEITKGLLERKVDRFKLIDQKTLDGILDKLAPQTKKDQPRGIQWVDQAVRTIDGRRAEMLDKVDKLLQGEPSHTGFQEALDTLQAFLDSLPAGFEGRVKTAPHVVAALKRAQEAATKLQGKVKGSYEAFREREYALDRTVYFELAKKLWNPETGHLQRFDFAQARSQAQASLAMLRVGSYQQLGAQWPPLIDALEALFKRTIEAGGNDGWVDDDFTHVDERGRERSSRIRDISAEGVKWDRDVVPFHRSSPRWLLDKLFLFEGKPRLKAMTPADHAGLGLLAELAGRYDVAATAYQAGAAAEGDLGLAARSRLTRLDKERAAAERFFAVIDFARTTRAWAAPYEVMKKALDEDPEAFTKEARETLTAEKVAKEQRMQKMRQNLDELRERADLARTMWGSALRERIHPRAAYAGEALPEDGGGKDGPPRKNVPPKDDGEKDGAGKDAGSANGGDGK